jgi:hypothetical protein
MILSDLFWNATIQEIMKGYVYSNTDEAFTCLVCGKKFENGVIYSVEGRLLEAERAAREHIDHEHGSMFECLLHMDKNLTGLSDVQKELLLCFHKGLNDKQIVEKLGGGSTSTIRNHRFKLREREKQARVFLALMGLLEVKREQGDELVEIHSGARMVDERFAITQEERETALKTYFREDGTLKNYPSREKRKIIVLQQILKSFEPDRRYAEKEVNAIIKAIYHDFATIRRYLIEYGLMGREKDCSAYWVKG